MFLSPALDLPVTPSPITSSLYRSRCEEMAVVGPGPQWLGETLCDFPAGSCFVEVEKLPYLSIRRIPSPPVQELVAHLPTEHFRLTSDNPVVVGVAGTMFPGSRLLDGIEYDVLSDLVDELALASNRSRIPGML